MLPLIQNEQFDAMRVELQLWPEMPRVERAHILGVVLDVETMDGGAIVCAHDAANGGKHQLLYSEASLASLATDDPEQSAARLRQHAGFLLCAQYN